MQLVELLHGSFYVRGMSVFPRPVRRLGGTLGCVALCEDETCLVAVLARGTACEG